MGTGDWGSPNKSPDRWYHSLSLSLAGRVISRYKRWSEVVLTLLRINVDCKVNISSDLLNDFIVPLIPVNHHLILLNNSIGIFFWKKKFISFGRRMFQVFLTMSGKQDSKISPSYPVRAISPRYIIFWSNEGLSVALCGDVSLSCWEVKYSLSLLA